jgi:hypothetical protein
MSARTIPYRMGLFGLLEEILYSQAQAEVEPLAAPHVPTFQGHRAKWQAVLLQEIELIEAIARAQAAVDRADRALDRFVDRVFNAIEEHTAGDTKKNLIRSLFKGKSRSRFRRPVLGRQIREMETWSGTLEGCGVAPLVEMSGEAKVLWESGKAAETLRNNAKNANRDFRDVGARKQFIDGLNADRKEIDGALGKLPFQNLALPRDFNESFFLSEPPRDEEETIEDVKSAIDELKVQLAAREEQLAQMEKEAKAEAEALAAAARTTKNTQAAELRVQAQKLLEEAAKLEKSDDDEGEDK